MFEILWNIICFVMGIGVGKARAINTDITERTAYMQDLINKAYIERDRTKQELDFALIRIDMWQERYSALLEELERDEDGLGSSNDGSFEGSKRSD